MTEQFSQSITHAEISEDSQEEFEKLIAQYRAILATYNCISTAELIQADTKIEDVRQALKLLRRIKQISKGEKTTAEIYEKKSTS